MPRPAGASRHGVLLPDPPRFAGATRLPRTPRPAGSWAGRPRERPTGSPRRCTRSSGLPATPSITPSTRSCTPFRPGSASCSAATSSAGSATRSAWRKALILSTLLAAVFIVPFGYVTNYPALIFLSIGDTLGFAGFLALNVDVHERDGGAGGPEQDHHVRAGARHHPGPVHLARPHPALHDPRPVQGLPVAAGRAEPGGDAADHLAAARVAALAGGQGTH